MSRLVCISFFLVPFLSCVAYLYVYLGFNVTPNITPYAVLTTANKNLLDDDIAKCFIVRTPSPNFEGEDTRPQVIAGSEDIVSLGSGLFLVSSGDLHAVFNGGTVRRGRIFAIQLPNIKTTTKGQHDDDEYQVEVRPLEIEGFDTEIGFQPHGIYFSSRSNLLYVVSHGLNLGGTRVVIIRVSFSPSSSPSISSLRLTYLLSVSSPLFRNCALNDVVEGHYHREGQDLEFIVTEWLTFPFPVNGKKEPQDLSEVLNLLGQSVAPLVLPWSRVFSCRFSLPSSSSSSSSSAPSPSATPSCSILLDSGLYSANGITKVLNGTGDGRDIFLINDLPSRTLHRFLSSSSASSSSSLDVSAPLPPIHLRYLVDNIEYDASTGLIYAGNVPVPYLAQARLDGIDLGNIPGGMTVIDVSNSVGIQVNEEYFIHDGRLLSGVSSAAAYKNWVLLGSPFDDGVLICNLNKSI